MTGLNVEGEVRMPQERSFWRLVCDAAARVPERVVLADDYGRTLTTAQVRNAAERVAAGLPVRPGMVVSWQLPRRALQALRGAGNGAVQAASAA
jgi:non-ribosomal peptide synthetase component E (peptide arylation enzyme)